MRIIIIKIMILIRLCRWGSNINIYCQNYKLKFHFTLKTPLSQYLKLKSVTKKKTKWRTLIQIQTIDKKTQMKMILQSLANKILFRKSMILDCFSPVYWQGQIRIFNSKNILKITMIFISKNSKMNSNTLPKE